MSTYDNQLTMQAKDALHGAQARCFITIGENRFNFCQAKDLEANIKKKKTEVPILGRTGKGNKAAGWSGTGKATFYMNTSMFRELLLKYKDTGVDTYFDIQITNEDPSSIAGRQTITLINCNLDGGLLAKFDTGADLLEETMDFTFEDFTMSEMFLPLPEMAV